MKNAIKLLSVLMAMAFCGSALADPPKPVVKLAKQKPRKVKVCYVMTTASGIPLPCERIRGIPTTPSPMDIIGNKAPY
ncbi:MAG TPA: hypothetical protein VGG94_02385 [Chthoniobacterales bacterium]